MLGDEGKVKARKMRDAREYFFAVGFLLLREKGGLRFEKPRAFRAVKPDSKSLTLVESWSSSRFSYSVSGYTVTSERCGFATNHSQRSRET